MSINKGDLVKIDLNLINHSELEESTSLFMKNIKNNQEIFLVASSPYENQITQEITVHPSHRPFFHSNLIICVDLIFKSLFLKSVPIKYLKRIS
jgi:hypothetical protein